MHGWFLLARLPWIPPCYARGIQAPVQPLGHQFPSSSIGDEFNKHLFLIYYYSIHFLQGINFYVIIGVSVIAKYLQD